MLPDTDELAEVLLDLAVPHQDINELIASRRTLTADSGAMRLLAECTGELVRDIGKIVEYGDGVQLGQRVAEAPAALRRFFAAYVCVAALPHTRAYHRALGIPADVSRRTLADLGRNMVVHRRRHGRAGVQSPQWLALHFRGELYQLGRLQFQRANLWTGAASVLARAGFDGAPGTPCLDIHIPEFLGPLTPAACDRSVALAREFFALHHPEEPYRAAMCLICAPVEGLDLGETFEVVMLASFLVHAGDIEVRRGLLRACARHVGEGGCVLIQREGADYHTDLPRERVDPSGFTVRMVSAEPVGDGVNSVRAEYEFPDAGWTQTFLARPLTKKQFEEALGEAGLAVDKYLTEDGTWVRAVRVEQIGKSVPARR